MDVRSFGVVIERRLYQLAKLVMVRSAVDYPTASWSVYVFFELNWCGFFVVNIVAAVFGSRACYMTVLVSTDVARPRSRASYIAVGIIVDIATMARIGSSFLGVGFIMRLVALF